MDLIKTAVLVYDTLTLPFYYLIQKPWKRRSDRPTARLVKEAPDLEYLVRVGEAPKSHLDHYENVSQAMSDVCARYSSQKCFGVRECIFEEEIPIEKGKVHKKKVLAPAYRWYTYSQVDNMIDALMRGLRESGLEPGSRVVIFSETRMEWMLAFHSLVRMNCTVVTLYSNLGRDGILHVLNEVEAQFAIVSSEVLSKVKSISKDLKYLSNIVVIGPENSAANTENLGDFTIETFGSVMSKGSEKGHLMKPSSPKPSDIVLIMYTSGSTGIPKGVQISHRNFISSTRSMVTIIDQYGQCRAGHYIAYLPLAHVFECFVESTLLWMGHSIGYSNPLTLTDTSPALKEGVKGDLTTLQPILLCGVPLVLDRIRKEVTKKVESNGGLKEKLFKFSVDYKNYWLSKGYKTPILDRIVFKQTVAALGGHCEVIVSGGAPLSLATQRFARACLGADLVAGYSATECASSGTCMDIGDSTLGNVGAPLYGIKIRLVPWADGGYYPTDKPNPRGEIVIGGDNIAMGYFNNPEETKLSFKEEYGERWFYTGDIGETLPNGSIKIIDRRKDLVKLQLGEYISLGKVEAALLGHPLVDFVCLHGDSLHNFPVALIVPNAQGLLALAKSLNLNNKTIDELCEDSTIIEAVKVSLTQYSGKVGLNKYEVPQKIKLCKEEWTPDSGLVTAAMKVRRNEIRKFYCEDLKHLYGGENFDQNQNMRKV